METSKNHQLAQKIENGLLFVWGITLLVFPLVFTTYTTDIYVLPKMLLLAGVTLISLLAWGVTMMLYGQVRLRRTPFDIPVLLFALAVILSSVFATNRFNSIIATANIIFMMLAYFILVNLFHNKKATLFFVGCLVTGGVVASAISVLTKFHIYLLPFAASKTPIFSTLGSNLDFALYAAILLPIALSFVAPALKKRFTSRVGVFTIASLVLAAAISVGVWKMSTDQKVVILPFDTGFQTSFAAISQDSGHVLQSFFFGLGFGNYNVVFSRFHPASFNTNNNIWFYTFNSSSSLVLELLGATGLVGILAYFFLLFKVLTPIDRKKANPLYFSLVTVFILSLLLPFSAVEITLLFIITALFAMYQRDQNASDYFDVEIKFVALKKGVFAFTTLDDNAKGKRDLHPTPIAAFVVLLVIAGLLAFYTAAFAYANILFQQSLAAANNNNGAQTYKLQVQAISTFPYSSAYYRAFSQTNVALASSLLALSSNKGASPSSQAEQTAFTLVQQGITTAQTAIKLAPQSAIEWQNLSSVYRALIGMGQNAQSFSISAAQQAVLLDPNNPQEYLTLGGIYYQVGQYDSAIRMFQQAIALKNDYANAYYNLGHAYEQKGDLQNALAQYEVAQNLVNKDQVSYQQITKEIDALKTKIGSGQQQQPNAKQPQSTGIQQPLSLPGQTTPSVTSTPNK